MGIEGDNFNAHHAMGGFRNENASVRRSAVAISYWRHFAKEGNSSNQFTLTQTTKVINGKLHSINGQNEAGRAKNEPPRETNGGAG